MTATYPKLETRKLSEVKAKLDGLRDCTPDEVYKLGKRLEHFGLLRPPTLNHRTGHVLDGDRVVLAMRDSGALDAPFWVVDIPEEDEDAAHLALNNHCGEWQWQPVSMLLKQLKEKSVPLELTGFHDCDTGPLTAAEWKPAEQGPMDGSDPAQLGFL